MYKDFIKFSLQVGGLNGWMVGWLEGWVVRGLDGWRGYP